MADLYWDDVLLWSQQQASVLRRLAAGERVNDQVDWENVIEEIESVGNEQLHAVESLLLQALIHMLKAEGWPLSRDAPTWRADSIMFRGQAARRYAASMRQKLDIADIYRLALRSIPETMDDQPPLPLPDTCPVTLDELLSDQP